jgi:PEP-CTERM motif
VLLRRNVTRVFFCILQAAAGAFCFGDIVIDNYSDATNDRFTNNPNFIAAQFNLSGVGQNGGGIWATAISRNVVISASHSNPNGTFHFFPGNDPGAQAVSRTLIAGKGISVPGTDIFLSVLDSELPSNIVHYNIADLFLTGQDSVGDTFFVENAGALQGLNAYLIGRSPFNENIPNDNRFGFNDQAVGRNRISGYSEDVPFGSSDNDSLIFDYDAPASANYVQFEAAFRGGDSGAPAFIDVNGQLLLIGTNAFVYNDLSASGINYVGNQYAAIQNYIQINAVPEPSSMAMVILAGGGLITHLRRRRV